MMTQPSWRPVALLRKFVLGAHPIIEHYLPKLRVGEVIATYIPQDQRAYYERFITTATALVLLIWVRRFLCRVCGVSVSCLPAFAQPYRPVNTPTIAAGFEGQDTTPQVQR